jgi:hypothetical protein
MTMGLDMAAERMEFLSKRTAECCPDPTMKDCQQCRLDGIEMIGIRAMMMPGYKADETKPRMDLIAPEIQTALAEILTFGAKKYADRNWEKGMKWGRCFGALMRHMWAWWAKEPADPETGKSHLWHAACCLMFLIAYEARNVGEDDRA